MDLSSILFIIFVIFYCFLAKFRLKWAILLLIAALPAYQIRIIIANIPITLLEIMILVSFAVWVLFHTRFLDIIRRKYSWQDIKENRKKRNRYPFAWEMILLLFVSYAAVAVSGFSAASLGIWKAYFYEPVLVFILILNVFKGSPNNSNSYESNEGINNINGQKHKERINTTGLHNPSGTMEPANDIFWALCFSALGISLVAIIEKLTGWLAVPEFWPRVTGPFPYPNALGLFLAPLVLVLSGWLFSRLINPQTGIKNFKTLFRSKKTIKYLKENIIIGITIGLSVRAIMFARSEGALVGIIAGFIVFGVFLLAGSIKKLRLLPVLMLSTLLVLVFTSAFIYIGLVPAYKYCNFNNKFLNYACDKIALKDLSGEIRKQQWRETFEMMKGEQRWLFGSGLANFKKAVSPYHKAGIFFNKDRDSDFRRKVVIFDYKYKQEHWQPVEIYMYPHNLLLNFWTELGLIGVLLFVWIIVKFFFLGIRNYGFDIKKLREREAGEYLHLGLMCSMVVIVVHGLVDVPYFKNDLAVMFWVLTAMMCLVRINDRKDVADKKA